MSGFFSKIFLSEAAGKNYPGENPYATQSKILSGIWNSKEESSYGIERFFQFFVCLFQFIFPILFIRFLFMKCRTGTRKLVIDFYIILKLIFPILILFLHLYSRKSLIFVNIYLMFETVFLVFGIILIADESRTKLSYIRSLLILIIYYFQVTLGFSVIYIGYDLFQKELTPIAAIYASFVTTTTLGFGDYLPRNEAGQVVVILQLIAFILFVLLFINYFTPRNKLSKIEGAE